MPGIIPSLAYSRKQIRHKPKSRIKPFLRPQQKQRRTIRLLNFGFLSDLAITDFFAILIKTSPPGLIHSIKITKAVEKVKRRLNTSESKFTNLNKMVGVQIKVQPQ